MKKLVAGVLAAALVVPGVAGAADGCYSQAALEAEQGMRFLIDLMVASTACRDQTYGEFQQRNKTTVLSYQKAMISHFHGNAAYDRWDTALANDAALKQAGKSAPQACQEAADLLKKAAVMDDKAYRAYAVGLATTAAASGRYPKCGGR
ncbi:MAG TPA: hypothetical protein VM782_02200 [Stellaceae bacterium]|nr:hypothetical protein [Stellaceae bacterium]